MNSTRFHRNDGWGRSSRFYEIGGDRFPSVTTILSGAIAKPALINWAATSEREMVVETATRWYKAAIKSHDWPPVAPSKFRQFLLELVGSERSHRKKLAAAAEIGTDVHSLIEWSMRAGLGLPQKKKPPRVHPAALTAFARYEGWQDEHDLRATHIELTVFSAVHRYAGTADWIGRLRAPSGEVVSVLGDWKTGKAIYAEALLQNAAYVAAAQEMGFDVSWGVIVRLPKVVGDPGFELRWVAPDAQRELFEVFLAVKRLWEWTEAEKEAKAHGDGRGAEAVGEVSRAVEADGGRGEDAQSGPTSTGDVVPA